MNDMAIGASGTRQNNEVPRHVAIIMDGNGRWAQQRGYDRSMGHVQGVDALERAIKYATRKGIRQLTVYAFSTENWNRPVVEIDALMALLAENLTKQVPRFIEEGIALHFIGELDRLPDAIREQAQKSVAATARGTQLDLIVALSYSSQREIQLAALKMARQIEQGSLSLQQIEQQPELFEQFLQTHSFYPVDLLIRTGGESRVSNFLLYQIAYSELFFSDILWPDFGDEEFERAVQWFEHRERRFGRINRYNPQEKTKS